LTIVVFYARIISVNKSKIKMQKLSPQPPPTGQSISNPETTPGLHPVERLVPGDPAEIDARLNNPNLDLGKLMQLRRDAATDAARSGDLDRMYELLDPRKQGRFFSMRKVDAVRAPGPRTIILAEAVKAGRAEVYEEMVKNARKAVGTQDDQIDAWLAAAEAGWDEGITRVQKLINAPFKVNAMARSYPKRPSANKVEEAERRIAQITASQAGTG
jgi:hypothetical protein